MPPIVVAATPWFCRVFDRNAASESADGLTGAMTGDGGETGDCARTGDCAGLLAIDEIATAGVAGAAVVGGVVGAEAIAGCPLAIAWGLTRDGVGDGVATAGAGLAATATAHSVFG